MAGLLPFDLADINAAIDSRKRFYGNAIRGLLDNPRAQIDQWQAQNAEQRKADKANVGGLLSVMPQVQEDASRQYMDRAQNAGGLLGMTVYHGSPHLFDKFDMSKIGTGEGAQAYGHGLYFAENPEVSKSYMKTNFDFAPIAPPDIAENLNLTFQDMKRHYHAGGSTYAPTPQDAIDRVTQELSERMKVAARMGDFQTYTQAADQMVNAGRVKDAAKSVKGNLYKVDIPDEHIGKMLDWDKPLSQQPESVRAALKGYRLPDVATGKQVYDALQNRSMSAVDPSARKGLHEYATDAAFELRSRGIPGIRYLDQGSRGKGGTSNFVVFDDKLPKILGVE